MQSHGDAAKGKSYNLWVLGQIWLGNPFSLPRFPTQFPKAVERATLSSCFLTTWRCLCFNGKWKNSLWGSISRFAGMKEIIHSAYKTQQGVMHCAGSHTAQPWHRSHTSIAHNQFMAPELYLGLILSLMWSMIITTNIWFLFNVNWCLKPHNLYLYPVHSFWHDND